MEKNCDTCAHKAAESEDGDGNRIIDCEENEHQLFAPFAEECVHWEKAVDGE